MSRVDTQGTHLALSTLAPTPLADLLPADPLLRGGRIHPLLNRRAGGGQWAGGGRAEDGRVGEGEGGSKGGRWAAQ